MVDICTQARTFGVLEFSLNAPGLLRSHSRTTERHPDYAYNSTPRSERLIESCDIAILTMRTLIGFSTVFTGSDRSVTDYILEEPAKCANCRAGEILEKSARSNLHT